MQIDFRSGYKQFSASAGVFDMAAFDPAVYFHVGDKAIGSGAEDSFVNGVVIQSLVSFFVA